MRPLESQRPTHTVCPDDHFVVGQILRAHGTRGEVRVRILSDNEARFLPDSRLDVSQPPFTLTILQARRHKDSLLVQFSEVTSRTRAETLRGAWLSVSNSKVPELDPGSYWIHDIIGCQVQTEEGRLLGRIRQVLSTGANDVYEVEPAKELGTTVPILVPATTDVIRFVDIGRQIVIVHLLPGLVECLS